MSDFQSQYHSLSDGELLRLSRDQSELVEEAKLALASEIHSRGLSKRAKRLSTFGSKVRKNTDEPKTKLSDYAPFLIIPTCALAVAIIFFVLPAQFRNRWGDVAYVLVTCLAIVLFIVRPTGLLKKGTSALFEWLGLVGCGAVAAFAVKWGDAGGKTVLWRGAPLPAGVVYGVFAFLAAYLTLFFCFGMYRSGSWPRSVRQGRRG